MDDKKPTICTMIESACEEICDNYCKFPAEYEARYDDSDEGFFRLCKEKCDNCPIQKLLM